MEELNETKSAAQNEAADTNENLTETTVDTTTTPIAEETHTEPQPKTAEPQTEAADSPEAVEEPAAAEPEADNAPEQATEEPAAEAAPAEPTAEPETVNAEPEAAAEATTEPQQPAQPEPWVEPQEDYTGLTREELIEKFKELLNEEVTKIKNRTALIIEHYSDAEKACRKAALDAFIAEGGKKEEYEQPEDPVSQEFWKLYEQYREKRQRHIEAVEAQKQQNLKQKQEILNELKALIDSDESLKKTHDDFNAIQEKWKSIGEVPRSEINNLWQTYHFLVEQFFNKLRLNKELKMLDMKRNMDQKVLCEKAEELIMESSINTAYKKLQSLREQWREIGPVPVEKNDEIWARFCSACDQIEARRREYFDQRKEELDKNLLAKQALCEKAEELTSVMPTSIKEWTERSTELDELLKLWKSIGPVPRESNEEIWHQFKAKLDKFYTQKKEHFDHLKDEQTENYNKKIDLCLKAEAIAKREDWKKATEEMLQLQEEWKHIGAVQRKVSEKVWQRFRSACDEFFNRKSEFFKNIRSEESENLAKKEAIIAELKAYQFGEDKEENLRIIKDFQRQWMEIGYVPISEKERLRKEFRAALDSHFEQLKISAREAEEMAYRERIKNVVGNMTKFTNDERNELQDKIAKLKGELNLWENNLGFLANSKQADLLKEEFEHKMQSARQQLALLEAKLRILNEAEKSAKEEKKNQTAAE